MNNLTPFNFNDKAVRVIQDNHGDPWFILSDICKVLGINNPTQVKDRLDDDEFQVIDLQALYQTEGNKNKDLVNVINESGLYSVVLRSDKPLAKQFKKWVTSEVLPSISKTGSYQIAPMFNIPTTLSEALLLAGKLAAENEIANAKIKSDEPKVIFAEAVRNMQGSCLLGDFAKAIGIGRNRLFKKLRDDGILMQSNKPYQKYCDQGLFVISEQIAFTDANGVTHPSWTTRLTGKGQVWLENRYRKSTQLIKA